ncbi:MAG: valine--tRNA ligase [Syntrophales bacterium]
MKLLSKSFEFREAEKSIYEDWQAHDYFHAEDVSSRQPFCIVIPPPNVTGILHMGHALNNVLQDIMIRYRRMQGYNALWMPGMDHAGIATQNVVEQQLAAEGISRHDLGREKFIATVWEWKAKSGGAIINQLKSLGCSCDWSRERFTMDEGLSRAVREAFVRLYNDGLIYQGDYIVNWCPRCHTAISDLEVEYAEEPSFLWRIRYPLAQGSGEVIVATTRPETMLGDTAVAVNPRDERHRDKIGKTVLLPLVNREIPIIADEYVAMEFGTGAVKITPACDPNDFAMAGRHSLPILRIMNGDAVINDAGGIYQGQDRYEARKNILNDLESGGYLAGREPHSHNIGHCYRCRTDIEPTISRQWFVKVKPLAKAAMHAVTKGKTRIIPPTWESTYFEWMNNIRDWCISRQIWWGHRIPVWYCACGQIIAAVAEPAECPHCGSAALKQDEDVLDTWFSSALWPFSTLGWPEKTPALKTFYPTSLLITGFDILFFWVARMMMMGLYIMKDIPFHDVYLHALVRDEKGEKMSKSKGNSIDPLGMIEKFGADAFRFTLAAFTAQGRDVRMSEERIEGYRYFVNKIWNMSKFIEMNVADYQTGTSEAGEGGLSLADRWIKSRLNATVSAVINGLEEYRFNEAAGAVYQFVWHELCDWYVELVKPVLYGKSAAGSRQAAQETLLLVLQTSLKLLHPFMPFMSEEVWRHLIDHDKSLMVSVFPAYEDALYDEEAERQVGTIMEVIAAIRNIRGEMGISPAKKLRVIIQTPQGQTREIVLNGEGYIRNLANLEDLQILEMGEEPKEAATAVAGEMKIFVLLGGLVDVGEERARLEKEMAKIDKDMAFVGKKLANRDFVAKAAATVVEKEEVKYRDLQGKRAVLEVALRKVKALAPPPCI